MKPELCYVDAHRLRRRDMVESKTLLIVDDDERYRAAIRRFLARQGYAIVEAPSARDAFLELARLPIDVILLDLAMPDRDGIEVLRELREREGCPPIIVCSGLIDCHRAAELLGARAVLAKPVDPDLLVAHIERVLAS
jgi:DNA-binding response OmpR family regulator